MNLPRTMPAEAIALPSARDADEVHGKGGGESGGHAFAAPSGLGFFQSRHGPRKHATQPHTLPLPLLLFRALCGRVQRGALWSAALRAASPFLAVFVPFFVGAAEGLKRKRKRESGAKRRTPK